MTPMSSKPVRPLPPLSPPGALPPVPTASPAGRVKTYFLTGLVVAGPVAITIYLIWSFVTWVDGLVRPFIPVAYRPETYLPVEIPGFGLIIAFLALTLLGFLTANLVGRTLVEAGEMILERMPIVRPLYRGLKQVFETLFSKSRLDLPQGRADRVSLARHVVPGVRLDAAGQRDHRDPAARGACLGIHAVYAEPHDRLFLLCAGEPHHRPRRFGRGGRQS